MKFTIHRSPFSMRYPLSVFRDPRVMVNGKFMVNGKWQMVNGVAGGHF